MLASYPDLRGKVVFITGGGNGIGGAMTRAFAEQGSLVAFVDIAEDASRMCTAQEFTVDAGWS
jgi:NAD(P)-dependent dehydrogenase (short-subunit alcohol dehydrogenase family)